MHYVRELVLNLKALLQSCVGDWVLFQCIVIVHAAIAIMEAESCGIWQLLAESFQPTLAHKDIAQA